MAHPSATIVGLFILLIGSTVADSERTPRAAPSSACQEHASLHNRLDVVEKKVEDTVGKLEAELAALLEDIEDPKWRPLLDKTGNPVDILEDPASVQS
ncbi:placenta-specific protein 9-like [Entelurus aequoreus]|uniref:placenta-specific protein 9-like n=1 Tax=Entelurus aequoreus TaxID=161455 RepID=UPI002B1E0DDA|nr:placenta-specific protein 9-like [Entelurus aequoreus]